MAEYHVKYSQNCNGATTEYKLDTHDSIWFEFSLNSAWGDLGCYAGAKADNFSLMGSRSVLNFTGWKSVPNYCNMCDYSISRSVPTAQQNLRFMIKFGSTSLETPRQNYLWTGMDSGLVQSIKDGYEVNHTNVTGIYDPYHRTTKNISVTGTANNPFLLMPVDSLKINDLIFVPYFHIWKIEYYNHDTDIDGYANISVSFVGSYTWSEIKNTDKTPAGNDYNSAIFDTGFQKLNTSTHEDGHEYLFCAGCTLIPYYGKCSNTYFNDTYTAGINPDDGNVYGDRQTFGSVQSDINDSPEYLNTKYRYANLLVMTETKSSVNDGIIYQLPTGIKFSNSSISSNSADFVINTNYSLIASYQTFGTNSAWSPFWINANAQYSFIYKNYDAESSDEESSPLLEMPGTYFELTSDIEYLTQPTTPTPTATRYYFDTDNPVGYSWTKSNRACNPSIIGYFAIRDLWATIASMGCYVADSVTTAQKAPTGKYTGNNNHLYLGYMDSNGITNGVMLQGSDLQSSTQSDIDDIIDDTPYVPVNPDIPTPSGEGQDDSSHGNDNNNLPNFNPVRIGGNDCFTSFYLLSTSGVMDIQSFLNQSSSTFWQALGTATDYKFSNLIDYVIGLKWYPLNLQGTGASIYPDVSTSNVNFGFSSDTKIPLISSGNYRIGSIARTVNLGQIFIPYKNNTSETFLDYEPYTNVSIWLPYCGLHSLQACETVGYTLSVNYVIDLSTGMCTALVHNGHNTILNVSGKIGVDLPVSGNDILTQSEKLASSYISAGSSTLSNAISLTGNISQQNTLGSLQSGVNTVAGLAQSSINIANAKRAIPVSVGAGSGVGATFANDKACVIVRRPNVRIPSSYGHNIGYVFNQTATINSLHGFTVCDNPDLSGIPADKNIIQDIYNILTTGFFVNN